jgi:ammonia channel protein AmtB
VARILLLIDPTKHQREEAVMINSGDTAWMLIATAMVMIMTPGLGFFYGGMVRSKNVLGTLMQSFMCLGLVSILWLFSDTVFPSGRTLVDS